MPSIAKFRENSDRPNLATVNWNQQHKTERNDVTARTCQLRQRTKEGHLL